MLSYNPTGLLRQGDAACCSALVVCNAPNSHVCKPIRIFCHVHAAAENDFNFFAAAAANSARLISMAAPTEFSVGVAFWDGNRYNRSKGGVQNGQNRNLEAMDRRKQPYCLFRRRGSKYRVSKLDHRVGMINSGVLPRLHWFLQYRFLQ